VRLPAADRYDPDISDAFAELGQHYGVAIIPAPPAEPKGKAKVEAGVLIAQRWILARLRNQRFFSLAELNNAIADLLEELNTRQFQKLPGTRRQAFESLDRPCMKALPALRFELPQRKTTRANIDYNISFDDRLYSVPFALRRKLIDVRATRSVLECFHGNVRVASHRRSYARAGTAVTAPEHRPREHADYGEWSPERMIEWAGRFGAHVAEVARRTMVQYPQPEAVMVASRRGRLLQRLWAAHLNAVSRDLALRRTPRHLGKIAPAATADRFPGAKLSGPAKVEHLARRFGAGRRHDLGVARRGTACAAQARGQGAFLDGARRRRSAIHHHGEASSHQANPAAPRDEGSRLEPRPRVHTNPGLRSRSCTTRTRCGGLLVIDELWRRRYRLRMQSPIALAVPLLLMAACVGQQLNVQMAAVKKQASFDLECKDVEVQELGSDNFGATGCGRRASYVTKGQCGDFGVESCTVVGNAIGASK
jgi:hypothetical protein